MRSPRQPTWRGTRTRESLPASCVGWGATSASLTAPGLGRFKGPQPRIYSGSGAATRPVYFADSPGDRVGLSLFREVGRLVDPPRNAADREDSRALVPGDDLALLLRTDARKDSRFQNVPPPTDREDGSAL